MRCCSKIILLVLVVLVCVAFVQGVIHAQTGVPVTPQGVTRGKGEQVALCHYWPLAVGNGWDYRPVSTPDAWSLYLDITDLFWVNGFKVWELTRREGGIGIRTTVA